MDSEHELNEVISVELVDHLFALKETLSRCQNELALTSTALGDPSTTFETLGAALRSYIEYWPNPMLGESGFESALENEAEAIECFCQALKIFPVDDKEHTYTLKRLAVTVGDRALRVEHATELAEAIRYNREVLRLQPAGDPERSATLLLLADLMNCTWAIHENVLSLGEAIGYWEEALEIAKDYKGRAHILRLLVTGCLERFEAMGHMPHLLIGNAYCCQHLKLVYYNQPVYEATDLDRVEDTIQLQIRKLEL